MKNPTIDVCTYSMLAIYVLVGKEAFSHIGFPPEMLTDDIPNDTDAALQLLKREQVLSDYQKTALFSYLCLYVKLSENENEYEDVLLCLRNTLNISKGVCKNLDLIITPDRVQYILRDYQKRQKNITGLFVTTEDYISDMITDVVTAPIQKEKDILNGLQSSEYEHPTDRVALEKLRVNKVLEQLLKWYSEYNVERLITVQYTGSCVMVTEKNIPYLYHALEDVCRTLEVSPVPPLYLEQGFIGARTIGSSKPIVCLTAACLSLLSYDELLFILGHEVGHIKSQHVLYHTLGSMLPYVGDVIGSLALGIGGLVSGGLELALYNWFRKSEFTADRAGLLACQNPDAAVSVMAKLAGFPPKYYGAMHTEHFLKQAVEFENLDSSKFNKVMKILSAMYQDHPWTVMRAQELNKWVEQGEYERTVSRHNTSNLPEVPDKASGDSDTCYCSNCGFELDRDAKFCKNCGSPNRKN